MDISVQCLQILVFRDWVKVVEPLLLYKPNIVSYSLDLSASLLLYPIICILLVLIIQGVPKVFQTLLRVYLWNCALNIKFFTMSASYQERCSCMCSYNYRVDFFVICYTIQILCACTHSHARTREIYSLSLYLMHSKLTNKYFM